MTASNEKLAQTLERFAALLRSGEWDALWWSWSPEYSPMSVTYQQIDDALQAQKSELVWQEFQFTLGRSVKKERV